MSWYIISQAEEAKWQRFPPRRQREFGFIHEPGYYRKATPFLGSDVEMTEDWDIDYNIYHVTTNLAGVISSGRLKSRKELGGTVGLGGGPANEAPNMISATYDYSKASNIYNDIKSTLDIVRGKIPAHTIFNSYGSGDFDESTFLFDILTDYLPERIIRKFWNGKMSQQEFEQLLDSKIIGGEALYDFMRKLEQAVGEYEIQASEYSDTFQALSTTGFTGSYSDMLKIDPSQVAILQLVAKKDAKPQHVPLELELRFFSQDLRVIRYLQP